MTWGSDLQWFKICTSNIIEAANPHVEEDGTSECSFLFCILHYLLTHRNIINILNICAQVVYDLGTVYM